MASSGLFGNSSLAPLYGVLVLVVLSGGFFLLSSEVATLREALLQSSARGSSYENNGGGDERQQQQQPATKIEYLRPLNPGSDLEKLLRQERFHRSVWPDRLKLFTVDDVMLEWYARSTWSCPSAELIGEPGRADGPKWMCTEEMDAAAGDDCLVYGVGIDGEVGWDVNIRQRWPQCEVHAFEINPTGGADVVAAMKANNITAHYGFRFHDLEAHMRDLGHSGRRLAAMKMDIEGAEFELFEKLFSNKEKRWSDVIGQIALELHATRAQHQRAFSFFKEMERQGFRVFAYEANGPDCAEIGWVTNHRADLLLQDMGETNGKKKV